MSDKIKRPNNEADMQNPNKGNNGNNIRYDQNQGNRGKQLNPNQNKGKWFDCITLILAFLIIISNIKFFISNNNKSYKFL